MITTRIHVALPCVARGVPVIFIQSPSTFQGSLRTAGLTGLFHFMDLTKLKGQAIDNWINNFDFEKPPPNPNFGEHVIETTLVDSCLFYMLEYAILGLFMRLRATFWNIVRFNLDMFETAYRFGLIPMNLPPSPNELDLVVHFVIDNMGKAKSNSHEVMAK